jgi:hypothetical protein
MNTLDSVLPDFLTTVWLEYGYDWPVCSREVVMSCIQEVAADPAVPALKVGLA